jgi:hypothetical protein
LIQCNYFSISQLENADPNAEMIAREILGDFLNPTLALLGQGLKKSPIGQTLDFANHPYLCKGLLNYITPQLSAITPC